MEYWKGPIFFKSNEGQQKNIIYAINFNILKYENMCHILKLMKMEIISQTIYINPDYQCMTINYLLNDLFKYNLNILIF